MVSIPFRVWSVFLRSTDQLLAWVEKSLNPFQGLVGVSTKASDFKEE